MITNPPRTAKLSKLKPSPENDAVYGKVAEDNDLIDLANDIAQNGLLEPIVILKDGVIVSGHRRYAAARLAGLNSVPVIVLDSVRRDYAKRDFMRLLTRYNRQRVKSDSQRMNERLLQIDPDIAHQQLIELREELDRDALEPIPIDSIKRRAGISAAKRPMLNAVKRVLKMLKSFGAVTVRMLHYQLLNNPPLRHSGKPNSFYQNDRASYQDLCESGAEGKTADECEAELGFRQPTAAARCNELLTSDPPLVVRSGRRRPTRSGRSAHVLCLPQFIETEVQP